jgi:hypothetical protein
MFPGLKLYLKCFYSKSASFNNSCYDLEGFQNVSLRVGPTFEKLDIKHKEVTVMNQNEAIIEILQLPYFTYNDIRRLESILLLAKDTTELANFIVSAWLNFCENDTFSSMNLKTIDGVFLLKIAYSENVTDLNKMLEERFEMEDFYYSQRIIVIFECIHTDHLKLKAIYDLACSCKLNTCKFIIITKIEKQIILELKLDVEFILIAAKIDTLYVYSKQMKVWIDGQEASKSIDQIVSKRNCILWRNDAITKICFENVHPQNQTATIRIPNEISSIEFYRCSHKIQVMHHANHLHISEPQPFTNPLTENILTPTLTTLAIKFKSPSHIFFKSVYETFAVNISKATHLVTLHLCNMKLGRKSITVELQRAEIEQIRHSIEPKENFCRFGARILGPRLGKISFDKGDVEAESKNLFLKQIMLDLICYELVKTHSSVSECYPSEIKDGEITLICFVNNEVQINYFKGFRLLKRDNIFISKESLLAENVCDKADNVIVKAAEEEFSDINETLSFHAEALMKTHRNLEAVKVSFVQPKDVNLVQSKLCIVLYCRAKGYIPYGDLCFPRTLIHPIKNKVFRTDVREGFFSFCPFCAGRSTDFNQKIALGCSIGENGGKHAATLGPFVKIKETNETCFLTVRHVFAPPSRTDDSIVGVKVVQPADVHLPPNTDTESTGLPNRQCGEVKTSHIGGQIDACLVKISQDRLPTSGQLIQMTKEDLNLAGNTYV